MIINMTICLFASLVLIVSYFSILVNPAADGPLADAYVSPIRLKMWMIFFALGLFFFSPFMI